MKLQNTTSGSRRKKIAWFLFSLGLLLLLVYIADIEKFVESLSQVDPLVFATAVFFGMSSLLIWTWVWKRIFSQVGIESTFLQTARMFVAGHFLNGITPLGQFGGEPLFAYIISSNTNTNYEKSFTVVLSSDILNATPFFTFILGGLAYMAIFRSVEGFLLNVAYMAVVLLCVGGLLAYLIWFDSDKIEKILFSILDALSRRFEKISKVEESIRESLQLAKDSLNEIGSDPVFLLKTAFVSHLSVVSQILSLYFILLSLGIEPLFLPIYFTVNLAAIALFSPTPGGSGTYEASFAGLMLVFFSVDTATAVTAAILFRLTTYWPGLLVGYLSLLSLKGEKFTN